MSDPCILCAEHPPFCKGICKDKMKYIRKNNIEIPVESNKHKNKLIISVNKNGIRKEEYR